MPYCVKPKQIREIDAYCAEVLGIPEGELMWNAAEAIAAALEERLSPSSRVLFLCGVGGNGGDGYGAAAILASHGYNTLAVDVFGKLPHSDAARDCLSACRDESTVLGFDEFFADGVTVNAFDGYDAVVECILGTGAVGELPPAVKDIVFALNSADGILRVAVDSPVGIDAEWGEVHGPALRCDLTLAISFYKIGQLSYPAREYCGEIQLLDIGQDEELIAREFELTAYTPDSRLVKDTLPSRHRNSHKGTYGKLLIVAGCDRYRGAVTLATNGALAVGAGLVTLASEEAVIAAAAVSSPETVYLPIPPLAACSDKDLESILEASDGASAVLIGCGCGVSESLEKLISALLSRRGAPLIIDADGLNAIATTGCARELIAAARRRVVITPHPAEFARLGGYKIGDVQSRRLHMAENFATIANCVCVLKGAATVISSPDGTAVNTSGSPALAKAGSGDVLAGAVAGLCAQGIDPYRAAVCAAYLHGRAGDALADVYSEYGVMPSSLPGAISKEIRKCKK